MNDDQRYLLVALDQARQGRSEGGVPVGAALVVDGEVLGVGHNRRVQMNSVIRHGETDCLENVGRLPASVYRRSTLYTTLSPCHMCTGTVLLYGIGRVVIGESTSFQGPEHLLVGAGVEVVQLNDAACISMMTEFIRECPELWNEDIGVDESDEGASS
jgi:creatinine deaminase